jgi:hypothetical protein
MRRSSTEFGVQEKGSIPAPRVLCLVVLPRPVRNISIKHLFLTHHSLWATSAPPSRRSPTTLFVRVSSLRMCFSSQFGYAKPDVYGDALEPRQSGQYVRGRIEIFGSVEFDPLGNHLQAWISFPAKDRKASDAVAARQAQLAPANSDDLNPTLLGGTRRYTDTGILVTNNRARQ